MFRIVILGGYGVFGGRLARLLAREPGMEIYIAGRRIDHAKAFCDTHQETAQSRFFPLAVPDLDELGGLLEDLNANLLVNCIGPFQTLDYTVAETCIGAGVHYLDLADARAFVAGFGRLSDAAEAAGVLAVTGASTLPAISSAVVDRLSADLGTVDTIDMAIAPGLRMPRGVAVARAILGYAGQPVRVWRDKTWQRLFGWQDLRRRQLRVGVRKTGTRWLGICDVPDLDLFPARYPAVRTVEFRAGLELALLHFGLWAATWLVRARLLPSLEPFARPMKWLADLFQPLGSDRGGMFVDVTGLDAHGFRVTRTWTLIADSGHGPWIPILPALVLARKIRDHGPEQSGAFACMGFMDLAEFEATITDFDIETEISEQPAALFHRALGPAFEALAPEVRQLHMLPSGARLRGTCEIEPGGTWLARALGRIAGLPQRTDGSEFACEIAFEFMTDRDDEVWTRNFAGKRFRTRLSLDGPPGTGRLRERFGLLTAVFTLTPTGERVVWKPETVKLFGIPVPAPLRPRFQASEWQADGRYRFDVELRMPLAGRIIRYRGNLETGEGSSPAR